VSLTKTGRRAQPGGKGGGPLPGTGGRRRSGHRTAQASFGAHRRFNGRHWPGGAHRQRPRSPNRCASRYTGPPRFQSPQLAVVLPSLVCHVFFVVYFPLGSNSYSRLTLALLWSSRPRRKGPPVFFCFFFFHGVRGSLTRESGAPAGSLSAASATVFRNRGAFDQATPGPRCHSAGSRILNGRRTRANRPCPGPIEGKMA